MKRRWSLVALCEPLPPGGSLFPLSSLRRPLRRARSRAERLAGLALRPVHPRIESYLEELGPDLEEPVLDEMEAYAHQRGFPIVGPTVGHFLQWMARASQARTVFELGSGYGYSALWFARGLGPEGRVICTDGDPANRELARDYLSRAGVWHQVQWHTGLAQDALRAHDGPVDICYNDVDKGDYPAVWHLVRDRLRPGGLYIADNTLWSGRVALERYRDFRPGWTQAIREHNQLIFDHPDFDAFIHPVRDGVLVARRR